VRVAVVDDNGKPCLSRQFHLLWEICLRLE
jgi:hypothetical protein